ncbi:energy transducer TonB [Algoriphagus kandeliae]|uniref:Energy transducer TonB n=1 Tax=Algoriphagus kandeliae TaxID=2562278 RepID=A0A4Y9QX52_9BACT|nr:energy transducer TonB [Algoriphagus kandeliae]TFV95833.1 energy transducer TonB [Algoriphagus kandeliae]
MKIRFFVVLGFFFILCFVASAQEQESSGSLNKLVRENLKLPSPELFDGNKGRVILSLKVTEEGLPDSVFLAQSASESFDAESLRVMELIIQNWDPTFLENRPSGDEYLLVFSFYSQIGKPDYTDTQGLIEKFIKKEKFEKAFDLINQEIEENPFNWKNYATRSEIYRLMGKTEDSQRDFMTAKQIKKKVLVSAEVKAFGVPRPITKPGTIVGISRN